MEIYPSTWHLVIALITLAIITISFYSHSNKAHKRQAMTKALPPQARGGLPVFGHLFHLSGPKPLHIVLSGMSEKYGSIFTIKLGQRLGLVINSSELAKECYKTNDTALWHRPQTVGMGIMGYNYAIIGFNNHGPFWREMRKISMLRLLSSKKVSALGPTRESEIRAMIKVVYNEVHNRSLDMSKYFGDLMMSLMVRTVAGEVEKKMDLSEKERWRSTTREFFRTMTMFTISDVIPSLKWLDTHFGSMQRTFKRTAKEFDTMLQEWLEEHKELKKTGVTVSGDDFMSEMLNVADGVSQEFPRFDADTINKATCQTMMVAGTDTMSVALIWTLSLILNNRHAMTTAQQELDTHVGRERLVQESDIDNLVYIQAIIKESMRLQPPAPVNQRETSKDCVISGYHVPANTFIFINNWKIQRDPHVWPDPFEFKPERFLTTHKEVDVYGMNFELVPFGGGRRICPATHFATLSVQLALASFLQAFDVDLPNFGEVVDMSGSYGTSNMKATPLQVRLKPRLSAELYG